jgi:sterol desaturase/sphingolipid hydroxylase (fatty acid hydroxylase superfamily)
LEIASIDTLSKYLLDHEAWLRFGVFLGVFGIMASWELFKPCRTLLVSKKSRWLSNLGIVVFNSILLRILFPTAAVGVAQYASVNQWGILNQVTLPVGLAIVISILILDFMIYWQHMVAHHVPIFWRLHRVHHADLDFDVTTGARFHPIEIVLSMLLKFLVIVLLGPPAVAVFLFEVILNGAAMFNHSNVSLPKYLDKLLRLFLVTPDMHRVHHSVIPTELNSNFGFNLNWWDRLFGTYKDQPDGGHQSMKIGLNNFRNIHDCVELKGLLLIPFKKADA